MPIRYPTFLLTLAAATHMKEGCPGKLFKLKLNLLASNQGVAYSKLQLTSLTLMFDLSVRNFTANCQGCMHKKFRREFTDMRRRYRDVNP